MSEVLIIITILIISSIIMAIIKKNIFIKVYNSLNTEDYDSFFKYVDSRLARAMMPIYTREILKLSAYIKTETNQGVTNQFNQMMKMNLTTYQLSDILVRGFNYYCNHDQINRCKNIPMSCSLTWMPCPKIGPFFRQMTLFMPLLSKPSETVFCFRPTSGSKIRTCVSAS